MYMGWCTDTSIPSFPISLEKLVFWAETRIHLQNANLTMIEHDMKNLEWAISWPEEIWNEYRDFKRFPLAYLTKNGAVRRVASKSTEPQHSSREYFKMADYQKTSSPGFLVVSDFGDTLDKDNKKPISINFKDIENYQQLRAKSDAIIESLSIESKGEVINMLMCE